MMMKYFGLSFGFAAVALSLGAWLGWAQTHTVSGMLAILWICSVLAVLEVSLSLDNAAVNASVLKDMDPVWQRRFLTWGILIAVFGMRVVFPLAIVAVAARLGPVDAFTLALERPDEYSRILTDAHVGLMGFGGAFLGMVGLGYFFDADKEVHWIDSVERALQRLGGLKSIELGLMLLAIWLVSSLLPLEESHAFLVAGLAGLVAFIAVDTLGHAMGAPDEVTGTVVKSGLASFLYLEVLDASFSFDGVIGAFALSTNLFVIAIGLGIGAMFVRSMTIYLVDRGTMSEYRFLESGAFYAILALAIIMFASVKVHIPEVVTGLVGAVLIGLAFWSSVRWNRAHRDADGSRDGPPLPLASSAPPSDLGGPVGGAPSVRT